MPASRPAVLVLGAGIQGICAALALARHGHQVTLIDQAEACMARTSLRNEAKIHLGFVYANDESFRTSSLMLEASLAFAPLLEEWLARPLDWPALRSRPFTYAVMRDSLLDFDRLAAFYSRVESEFAASGPTPTYLGQRPAPLWQPVSAADWPPWINSDQIQGLMQTAEVALDLVQLRRELVAGLEAAPNVELVLGHRVESAERRPSGFRVEGTNVAGEPWQRDADILVNCLWAGRLRLDEALGFTPHRTWVHRLKYRLLGRRPPELADLPSLTFVLGPYGDIATYPDQQTYFSWYPACLKGWSDDLVPPDSWERICSGDAPADEASMVAREALSALDRVIPGLAASRVQQVDGGVIFSWGKIREDVDNPHSELHERHAIGVTAHDGYFSIDTGKFTCAPLFASHLLQAIPS